VADKPSEQGAGQLVSRPLSFCQQSSSNIARRKGQTCNIAVSMVSGLCSMSPLLVHATGELLIFSLAVVVNVMQ
jgi:hypothetical protein